MDDQPARTFFPALYLKAFGKGLFLTLWSNQGFLCCQLELPPVGFGSDERQIPLLQELTEFQRL